MLAFIMGIFVSAVPVLFHGNAYYRDDMQAQFMSMYYAIGSHVIHYHSLPILTTQSWLGGNIAGEFQYGLFNPVGMLLLCFLPLFSTLSQGAAFLAITHYGILASGSYVLARVANISRRFSFIAAFAISTNNFIFYWFASSWFPEFTSMTFMVWAMAFLLLAGQSRKCFLAAIFSTYLTITAGFPQTVLALVLFGVVHTGMSVLASRKLLSFLPLAALGLGGALALVSFMPTVAMLHTGSRESGIYNHGFLVPAIGDVLFAFSPVHPSRMFAFGGYREIPQSIFYAGWFVLPILFFINWRAVRNLPVRILSIIVSCVALLMLTQGPEHFGPVRFPFRFVPYFHILLIVSVFFLWDHFRAETGIQFRLRLLWTVIALTTLMSVQQFPHRPGLIILSGLMLAVAAKIITYKKCGTAAWLALTCFLSVISRVSGGEYNSIIADWGAYLKNIHADNLASVPSQYSVSLLSDPFFSNDPARFGSIWFGNMGLVQGLASVNGYSPIGQRALVNDFFATVQGWTSQGAAQVGLSIDQKTGMSVFDLMRVSNVHAAIGWDADNFSRLKSSDWLVDQRTSFAVIFVHKLPNITLPGSLSWPVSGLTVEEPEAATATKETLLLKSRSDEIRDLIFARTFWPGYRATFNGVDVPVVPYRGYLLSVRLPPGHEPGVIVLSFHFPFLKFSLSIFALSILGTVLITTRRNVWPS